MKRILATLTVVLILVAAAVPAFAVTPTPGPTPTVTVRITGPTGMRIGTIVTLNVNVNVSGGAPSLVNFKIYIQYNGGQLTYKGIGNKLANWTYQDPIATPGQILVMAYDTNQTHPINSTTRVFSVNFYVNSEARNFAVEPGKIVVGTPLDSDTAHQVNMASTSYDYFPAHTQYSADILDPLSGNTNLQSLSVAGGTLTPNFAAATTEYSVDVPFETAKATIQAAPADATSTVKITSPDLVAGETRDATVLVTAASGATKTYTIHVHRAQDPNYKPSTDATLSSLSVDGFLLSPVFDPGTDSYVVWLPHETDHIAVAASPAFPKATFVIAGGDALVSGQDNLVTVTVTAEDGTTIKVYTIDAKRPDEWGGFTTPTAGPSGQPTNGQATPTPPIGTNDTPFPIVPVVIVLVVSVGLGIYIMSLLDKKYPKGGRHAPPPPPPNGTGGEPDGGDPPPAEPDPTAHPGRMSAGVSPEARAGRSIRKTLLPPAPEAAAKPPAKKPSKPRTRKPPAPPPDAPA